MAAVARFVPVIKEPSPGRFDTLGFVLSAVSITAIVVLAETGGVRVPLLAQLGLGVLAAGALALFVRHALRAGGRS